MTKATAQGHAKNSLLWFVCAILTLWLALAAAWWISARLDYGYPLWYRVLAIDEHIGRYAPYHPTKRDFARLEASTHQQVFARISAAVHGRGEPLTMIQYQVPGQAPVTLLDDAEVRHLEDVARLLRLAGWATLVVVLLWVPAMAWQTRVAPPSLRWRLGVSVVVLGGLTLVLWWVGPKAVFYQLHEWLFPPQNPWFFYWEESLMSTLMKAPYLFGAIAVQIAVLGLILLVPVHQLGYRLGWALLRRSLVRR